MHDSVLQDEKLSRRKDSFQNIVLKQISSSRRKLTTEPKNCMPIQTCNMYFVQIREVLDP